MSDNNAKDNKGCGCPSCERAFDSSRGMKVHHKKAHGKSISGVQVECDICGSKFRKKESWVDRVDHHLCSDSCKSEWFSQTNSGKSHPSWNGGAVRVSCSQCGEGFEVKQYRTERSENLFCSEKCHFDWRASNDYSGEKSPNWEGGNVSVECEYCGSTKKVKPYRTENHDRHFCSIECKSNWQKIHQSGQDNPRWRGGSDIYSAISSNLSDRSWVSIRDDERGGSCEMCGESNETMSLDVHHIVPILCGGVHESKLLMTLCRSCHMKAEAYTQSIPEFEPVLVE